MTKRKKTIMWSTIACLLVAGVAGTAVGVTYARFSSTGTGKGTATIAYWDVAINSSEDVTIKTYASPSADTYEGGENYDASYARTSTSDLMLAATVTNSGNVDALVNISQTGGFGYELRDGVTSNDDTNNYLDNLDSHFSVKLFQSDEGDITSDTDLDDLSTFTLTASETAYIYCEVVWTSDIATCFGKDADTFDTWIGTNVDYLTFTLAYTAIQTDGSTESESEEETESGTTTEPDPEPEDTNHSATDWYYLTNENSSGATLDNAGNYCLTEDVELTASMTISNDVTLCLNGHKLTAASSYNLDQLISVTNGSVTLEDCQENGYIIGSTSTSGISISGSGATLTLTSGEIKDCLYGVNLSNGATFNMSDGSITNATDGVHLVSGTTASISGGSISSCNDGVYQESEATLKLSGTPVISNNIYNNVYLKSGALITLGELTEGANIGVYTEDYPYYEENHEHLSVQISTNEIDTYYYENAINYIHSDREGSSYKLSRSNNDKCLNLIQTGMINVSVAVKNTTTTTSPTTFYVNGFSWEGVNNSDNSITWTTSSYNGTYSFDQYYDFGLVYTDSDNSFSIAPAPFAWKTDLDQSGLAPDNTLAATLTQTNATSARFGLYATQYQGQVDAQTWVGAVWYLSMYTNVTDYTTLNSIGDLTIVLEYDGSNLVTSWGDNDPNTNNVVSNVYFITTSETVALA